MPTNNNANTPVVNPFSFTATAQSVHQTLSEALKAIPDGKRGVLLGKFESQPDGSKHAQFGVAMHIGGDWQLAAGADWDGHHRPTTSFAVMDTW